MIRAAGAILLLAATAALAADPSEHHDPLDPARVSGPARRVLYRAQIMRSEGRTDEARRTLRKHLAGHPDQDHALLRLTLGQVLAQLDSLEAAREQFAAAVALEPDLEVAWRNRAEAAYGLERYPEAAEAFEQAWRLAPEPEPLLRYYQGVALLQGGEAGRSCDVLAALLDDPAPDTPLDWFSALVSAAIEADLPGRAGPAVEALTILRPDDPAAWYLAYQQAAAAEDYPRAVRNLTVTGFLRPLDLDERRRLGDLCLAAGAPLRAVRVYESVVDSAGSRSAADLDRLISANLAADRPGPALAALDRRLALDPDVRSWRLKGEILYGRGDYAAARTAFAGAAGLDPDDREFDLLQGYCLMEMGEPAEAAAHLRRAAEDPRWNDRAEEALRYLTDLSPQTEAARAEP